jgi:plastocyanin
MCVYSAFMSRELHVGMLTTITKLQRGARAIVPAILLALALAGCGGPGADSSSSTPVGGDAGQPEMQLITLTARDNLFEPKTVEVVAGKPIKLTVVNAGQNVHEVEVKDLMPETQLAPGQSKVVDIPAQQAGTHKIYCEIHEDVGMEGDFIVR